MQPRGSQKHPISQAIADDQGFTVEHIFFKNSPSSTGNVLQLSNNFIDLRGQMDCSQTPESCSYCMRGESSMKNFGFGNRSSTTSLFQGRTPEKQYIDTIQIESAAGSEDHCTCNGHVGISFSGSVSSTGSLMVDDNEAADEQRISECSQEADHGKILEMKMKMLQMRPNNEDPVQFLNVDQCAQQNDLGQPELPEESGRMEKMLAQRLDTCRKKMNRLQDQRDSLSKELVDFRKKQRKFELQRRNMEEMLRRMNNLQRKLSKKEEEMVECQLKEKEAKARLHELQVALQRSKAKNQEPEQLVKLIPSLRTWLRSLKKTPAIKGNQKQLLQVEQYEAILKRIMEGSPAELIKKEGSVGNRKVLSSIQSPKNIQTPSLEHNAPVDCIREVYELQKELQRLAKLR
ncbi:hypothetical protein KP509_28G057700 [Ceratopteris richardii]|uniref:Uncharacterized protein n=1 Tax=Ceratopteris richardii TaxID=49495 RepID=A0A8T2RDT2_CERRI|nr:hypothetical protein KP509_28G057700 [Ceratopteris richardii]